MWGGVRYLSYVNIEPSVKKLRRGGQLRVWDKADEYVYK